MPPSSNRLTNNVTNLFPLNGTDDPVPPRSSRNITFNVTLSEEPLNNNRRITSFALLFVVVIAIVLVIGTVVIACRCYNSDNDCPFSSLTNATSEEQKYTVTYDTNGDPHYRHPEPHPFLLHKLDKNIPPNASSKYVSCVVNEKSDPRVVAATQNAMPGPSGVLPPNFRPSHQPKGGIKRVAKEENNSRHSVSLQRQMSVRFEQNLSHLPRFSAAERHADGEAYDERQNSISYEPVDVHHGGYLEDREHSSGHGGNYRVSNRAATSRGRYNSSDSSSSKGSSPTGEENYRKDKRGAYVKGEYIDKPRDSHDSPRKSPRRDSRYGDNINALQVVEYRSQSCAQDHTDGVLVPLRVVLEYENELEHPPRRTASTEWSPLEQGLEFWRKEHKRQSQLLQQEQDEDDIHSSKVRFNDTGSLEEVNMDSSPVDFYTDMDDDEVEMTEEEQENERSQYVEIWKLRTTFEEDESEISDSVANFDANSPSSHQDEDDDLEDSQDPALHSSADQSPDPDAAISYTTSFESNTEPLLADDPSRWPSHLLQPPSYETRRQNYKSFLTSRLKRMKEPRSGQRQTPMEHNSFDSLETVDTGSSTDASRPEQVTTSFDSTTDNTDSIGDSQAHKLHQTQADSGYKSFETSARPPKLSRHQTHLEDSAEMEELMPRNEQDAGFDLDGGLGSSSMVSNPGPSGVTPRVHQSSSHSHRRASAKTTSKKRRDYGRDRDSSDHQTNIETETDSRSGGESYDESTMYAASTSAAATVVTTTPGGRSTRTVLLPQFFRHAGHRRKSSVYTPAAAVVVAQPVQLPPPLPAPTSAAMPERDYSVDEKTDALFREFSRCDPGMEPEPVEPRPRYHYRRLRANHNPDLEMVHQRRNKISPQDSIDEEHDENEDDEMQQADIPIIRVADEDSSDPV